MASASDAINSSPKSGTTSIVVLQRRLQLLERREVFRQRVQLGVAELHGGHKRAGLDGVRLLNPQAQICRSIVRGAGSDGVAAHKMRQVRAEAPIARSAPDSVAIDARGRFEDVASDSYLRILAASLLLRADPGRKNLRAIHVNAKQHLGVLRAAILRALAEKEPGAIGGNPSFVGVIGDQVGLPSKLGNPEAVIRIGGEQF